MNQGGGGEGSRGGAGEGYQEDRGEEPDNNNDPDFQPPPRKRPHNLANTSLTAEQVKRLLKSFLSDDCTLENLDLSANVLSMIEPDLMAKSLNKLKVVTLLDSNISVNQVGNNIISCN